MRVVGAALIADISNSTPLYEQEGTQRAFREIQLRLDEMRDMVEKAGGTFVHSKGDDILAFFQDADAAVEVARNATAVPPESVLNVHAGISWGTMLQVPNDLFGSPVNMAARLAALAKPREVLVDENCYETLGEVVRGTLRKVDVLHLKGASDSKAVYSHIAEDLLGRTENFMKKLAVSSHHTGIHLKHEAQTELLTEGHELVLGRAPDCDLVVHAPWVSRRHATVSVANGIVEFRDHSTLGSYLSLAQAPEFQILRASVTLIGSGRISLGAPLLNASDAVVRFEVQETQGTGS
ncbi:FHA domain-containing protein [Ruegeria sediminis]|uniref:FHA domain-containing protein n=1 Tax=Ruegeria sediminis TaxID=2583820 RepID=A0ABY2WT27_9RHOB|nr:FHA domain-containing protein [Ruegeria sediminis]TMV04210.1 FHA domain-containing protein [Ruegeria sediminis]